MRRRLLAIGYPRTQICVILALVGGAAFLFSAWTLSLELERMMWRYPLAAIVGYASFLLLIRLWIVWKRREFKVPHDAPHDAQIDWLSHGPADSELFAGGRSGGGGGAADWGESSGDMIPGDMDVDGDLWPVVLVIVAAAAGGLALIYAVYMAPVLLAEVMVDAVLVTSAYRRLRIEERQHWTTSVMGRTRFPAACLVVGLSFVGWVLEQFAPAARSIGEVIRTLTC
jgi:hypothetical protein